MDEHAERAAHLLLRSAGEPDRRRRPAGKASASSNSPGPTGSKARPSSTTTIRELHQVRNRRRKRRHRHDLHHDDDTTTTTTTPTTTTTTPTTTPDHDHTDDHNADGHDLHPALRRWGLHGAVATATTPGSMETPPPPAGSHPLATLALANAQHGDAVHGTVQIPAADGGARLEVELLAQGASLAKVKRPGSSRVGRLVRSSAPAGKVSFTVSLDARPSARCTVITSWRSP